jgi:glycerophosphoryl diester phosphodiesterase
MFPAYQASSKPLIIAHRGGAGLWPENTLFALQEAAKLGADLSEIDIHMSRDGVLVAIHDDRVDRTTNAKGLVQDMTLAELKRLDAGHQWTNDGGRTFPFRGRGITIPTLSEIFSSFPKQVISLEIKQHIPPIVAALRETIHRYDKAQEVLVSAFNPRTMKVFRRLYPKIASAATDAEIRYFSRLSRMHLDKFYSTNLSAFSIPLHMATERFIKAAHKKNKRVDVWTVNETADMRCLLTWGVDGILTDFPDRMLNLSRTNNAA